MNSEESKSGEDQRKKQRISCRPLEPMKGCVWMKLVETSNGEFKEGEEEEEWDYSSSILLNNLPLNLEIENLRNEIQDLFSNMFQNNPSSFTLRSSFSFNFRILSPFLKIDLDYTGRRSAELNLTVLLLDFVVWNLIQFKKLKNFKIYFIKMKGLLENINYSVMEWNHQVFFDFNEIIFNHFISSSDQKIV